ncbi:MAG: 50S ribosomal protein L30 [Clostridia bacterium 62_21]|nr:MAG: 50S ribosomal protein L30 [Clostridia bacterium 62_21]
MAFKITLVRSLIGKSEQQRATIRALGLRRRHQTVIKEDTPQLRGMLDRVRHLVKIEEV